MRSMVEGLALTSPFFARREDGFTMNEPSPSSVALRGLCPRCGSRTLFAGLATFAPKCRACGLDFQGFNVGDGPAAFLILIVGGLIVGLAIAVELGAQPPFWVHILLWLPLATAAVIAALRVAKAALLALEYRHRAREGRIQGGR
jgi:uncharacterized protein (DUF983 family)